MRSIVAIALSLVACGGSSSAPPHTLPPPDRAKLEAMSFEDRCDAVAPRATPCMDEIIVADAVGLEMGSDLVDVVREHVESEGKSSAKELLAIHRTECAADDAYPLIVLTCWSRPGCTQFATCIEQERRQRAPRRREEAAEPHAPAEPAAP